ncbi:N-acetylmuramoyl-L-alanine amidase [Grimontia sedimenti]
MAIINDIGITMDFSKPKRPVDRVFLHCSASDSEAHDNIETMRRWHLERGWRDVGYHYFIRKSGELEAGRSLEEVPAAQQGHNTGSIAICLHGLKQEKFTKAQFDTLIALCREIDKAYENQLTFHGHCEVSAKTCPAFDYKTVLGLTESGDRKNAPASEPQRVEQPILELTAKGAAVAHLQALLNEKLQIDLTIDGHFGQLTKAAVISFQRKKGLVDDGTVGRRTWEELLA